MAHAERAHARLSPSSAKRWLMCPGSVKLSEAYPDTTSSYASEGTAAHELAEKCLRERQDAASYAMIDGVEVDEDMAIGVQLYVDWVRSQVDPGDGVAVVVAEPDVLRPVAGRQVVLAGDRPVGERLRGVVRRRPPLAGQREPQVRPVVGHEQLAGRAAAVGPRLRGDLLGPDDACHYFLPDFSAGCVVASAATNASYSARLARTQRR